MLLGHRSRLMLSCSAAKFNSSVPVDGYYRLSLAAMASGNVVQHTAMPSVSCYFAQR